MATPEESGLKQYNLMKSLVLPRWEYLELSDFTRLYEKALMKVATTSDPVSRNWDHLRVAVNCVAAIRFPAEWEAYLTGSNAGDKVA